MGARAGFHGSRRLRSDRLRPGRDVWGRVRDKAREAQAQKYSPYYWTRAKLYLHMAREVAAHADFQGATRFGRLATEAAELAEAEASDPAKRPVNPMATAPAKEATPAPANEQAPAKPKALAPAKDSP